MPEREFSRATRDRLRVVFGFDFSGTSRPTPVAARSSFIVTGNMEVSIGTFFAGRTYRHTNKPVRGLQFDRMFAALVAGPVTVHGA